LVIYARDDLCAGLYGGLELVDVHEELADIAGILVSVGLI
jgi:hypothetical protein